MSFMQSGGNGIGDSFIPNFGSLVRIAIDRRLLWLQFIPSVAGCLYAVAYFWRNQDDWDWNRQGLWLLLIAVFAAPYSWFTDETVLLPVILDGLYRSEEGGNRLAIHAFTLIAAVALLEVLFGVQMPSGAYIWTTTAWLIWYGVLSGGLSRHISGRRDAKNQISCNALSC